MLVDSRSICLNPTNDYRMPILYVCFSPNACKFLTLPPLHTPSLWLLSLDLFNAHLLAVSVHTPNDCIPIISSPMPVVSICIAQQCWFCPPAHAPMRLLHPTPHPFCVCFPHAHTHTHTHPHTFPAHAHSLSVCILHCQLTPYMSPLTHTHTHYLHIIYPLCFSLYPKCLPSFLFFVCLYSPMPAYNCSMISVGFGIWNLESGI